VVVVFVVVAVVGGGDVEFVVVTGRTLVVVAFGVLDVVDPDGPVVAVVPGPVAAVVGALGGRVVDALVDSRPLALVRVFFLLWSGSGSNAPGGAPAVAFAM
jgi:hypothetical protein